MNSYVSLAKLAIETYIKKGEIISPPEGLNQKLFTKKAGVFVTIKKEGKLKGCIGTSLPTKENIAQEIIHNAISAATRDYRFTSVIKKDLSYLSYTVSVLSKPKLVKDTKELDPKKYGILVKSKEKPKRSGLLLPDLEGVDTVEKQISIACRKAGIYSKKDFLIYKFTIKKYR